MPYKTSKKRFEELAEIALGGIPVKYQQYFRNISIMIEDHPSEETVEVTGVPRDELLGLFSGQTQGEKVSFFSVPSPYPDTIFLYQKNIEVKCGSEKDLAEEIRMTILHEVGHYFGLSEEDLEEFESPE
ncbi:MAG TPA: metallopeptidase family protein [Thermodesulfovibrionales bacterium]|nr:metallopeptidase family protein [Thermodesulfovibrionales bacterium]